jgi:hypothetical protein
MAGGDLVAADHGVPNVRFCIASEAQRQPSATIASRLLLRHEASQTPKSRL